MSNTPEIHLKLTIEEANLVLEALGNLPFVRVYTLIGKIQTQGRTSQAQEGAESDTEENHKPMTIKVDG